MMSQPPIELKGSNFTLSVIHLYDSKPEAIDLALREKLQQAPAFLKNAPVVINVATLPDDTNWRELHQVITSAGLHIVGISGCRDENQKRALAHTGLPLLNDGKRRLSMQNETAKIITQPSTPAVRAQIISTPVRSGQQIYAHNCDLIVTSSISAGAELIADGNIHIYGTLHGRALAGASGDKQCQIFCTKLGAELVSIAGQYWLSDQIPSDYFGQAAQFSLLNNLLTIQPLN